MHSAGRVSAIIIFVVLISTSIISNTSAYQGVNDTLLLPAGGGYAEIYPALSEAAIANAHSGIASILILPISMASDAIEISDDERRQLLQSTDNLRDEIEAACQQIAGNTITCQVTVVPIFTREDASNPDLMLFFQLELSAIFIPDGNPDIAMQIIGGTLVEGALVSAHQKGTAISGTGAGGRLTSTAMLSGYSPGFGAENALNFGAVELWNSAEQHGFFFGFQSAVIDSHFLQEGNLGRLLNAIHLPEAPHLGIGVDTGTSMSSPNGDLIIDVAGRTLVMVLDAETYTSADGVHYRGCGETAAAVLPCTPWISLRNVLVQTLAPGGFTYDIPTRQHSLGEPAVRLERNISRLRTIPGYGPLILSGGLKTSNSGQTVLDRFVDLAGGESGRVLVISTGQSDARQAELVAVDLVNSLEMDADILTLLPGNESVEIDPGEYTGILITGLDPALVDLSQIDPVLAAWRQGTPLLLDDALASIAGKFYVSRALPPNRQPLVDLSASRAFLEGQIITSEGLSLISFVIEPRVMSDNRWGRLFAATFTHPENPGIGLNLGSAIEIGPEGGSVIGDNVVISLDLRQARLSTGANDGFVIANGLLDTFAPGELLTYQSATASPATMITTQQAGQIAVQNPVEHAATPVLITATPTPLPTSTATASPTVTPTATRTHRPTRTPRPTATPPVIPPPSNPDTNQWMVGFSVLIVVIILFGMLINRRRLTQRD
jgi:cyanophycinase-like exopeptidase